MILPVSVNAPTTRDPLVGFKNSTLAGSSGSVMLVDAYSLFVAAVA